MALICRPRHIRPNVLAAADFIRVQCNSFVRKHKGVFRREALLKKSTLPAVVGRLGVYESQLDEALVNMALDRLGDNPAYGVVQFSRTPGGLRRFIQFLSTHIYHRNYLHFTNPGWAEFTPFGRKLKGRGADLPFAVTEEVLAAYDAAMPGIELQLLMPPAARTKRKAVRKGRTIAEKRAAEAASKLKQWQRREKLAKGKVAQYRKRVAYYAKRGLAALALVFMATACHSEEVFVPGVGYRWVGPVYASPAPPAPPPQSYPGRWKRSAQWGASHSLLRPDNGLPQYGAGDSLLVPNSELHRFDLVPNRIQAVVPISPYNVNPYSNRGFQDALYPKQAR